MRELLVTLAIVLLVFWDYTQNHGRFLIALGNAFVHVAHQLGF